MTDDELRRRLQEILPPRARLDAAAAIDGAKRRRRPKVAALTAAATGAGVLIVAPFVTPGLTPLSPASDSSVLSERDDTGAGPEAAQPTEEGAGGADGSGGAQESAPEGEPGAAPCGLTRAGDVGLALRFLEDPAGAAVAGPGQVEARGAGLTAPVVVFVDVDALVVDGATASATSGATEQDARLADGGAAVLGVTTGVLAADACGPGTPSAPSPVALVSLDGSSPPIAVVGDPFDVR